MSVPSLESHDKKDRPPRPDIIGDAHSVDRQIARWASSATYHGGEAFVAVDVTDADIPCVADLELTTGSGAVVCGRAFAERIALHATDDGRLIAEYRITLESRR